MSRIHFVILLCVVTGAVFFISLSDTVFTAHEETLTETAEEEEVPFDIPLKEIVQNLAPQNELTLFPCSDCHDEEWEVDPARRDLEEPHDEIPGKFVIHDSEDRWCFSCHSPTRRDRLRLLSGRLVNFQKYYRLCEQCHKRVYREWKMGVHGKRTGYWNGRKEYMHCAQCHNPHDPPFKPIEPMPAPRKPEDVRVMSAGS